MLHLLLTTLLVLEMQVEAVSSMAKAKNFLPLSTKGPAKCSVGRSVLHHGTALLVPEHGNQPLVGNNPSADEAVALTSTNEELTRCGKSFVNIQRMDNMTKKLPLNNRPFFTILTPSSSKSSSCSTCNNDDDGAEVLVRHLDVVDMFKHAGYTVTQSESASIKIQRMDDVVKKLPCNRTFIHLEQILPPSSNKSNIRNTLDGTDLVIHHLDVVDMSKHAGNTFTRHESASIQIQRMDDVIKKLPFNRTFVLEQIRTPATLPSSSNKSNSCNKLDGTDLLIHHLDVLATLSLSVSVLFVFVDRQTCTSTKRYLK